MAQFIFLWKCAKENLGVLTLFLKDVFVFFLNPKSDKNKFVWIYSFLLFFIMVHL